MTSFIAQVVVPFISPALAWAGVALVSVPVAIHLLSRWRRKPQPWGAMRFLLEAYRKQKRRMHLEQWLLLLLRCLIVLLLGLALARPLMEGALGAWLGGRDSRGQTVNLVIDDAMSLQAKDGAGVQRFDQLISTAHRVVEALAPGDRATIWRAGRPATPVIAEPTVDTAALHAALQAMRPGYGRPDLHDAWIDIQEATNEAATASERSVTYLLSDFVRSANYLDQTVAEKSSAGSHRVIVLRPMLPLTNVQMSSVEPRRCVVWIGGSGEGHVGAEVRITRFAEDMSESAFNVQVELVNVQGRSLANTTRQAMFVQGESETTLGIDLPISPSLMGLNTQGGTLLALRAQVTSNADGLAADNQAIAFVEIRRRMRVAVVDEPGGILPGQDQGLTPGQWITLALNPNVVSTSEAIEVVPLAPSELNDVPGMQSIDAIMLMRPDRLAPPAWRELASYAQGGGLVWIFTPPNEGSLPWVTMMNEAFEPGWRVGLETSQVHNDDAPWGLTNQALTAAPLQRLAADWQALIRPIRVWRHLPLSTDEADAWIQIKSPTDETNTTLLAHRLIGRGSLMLLSTAVDTRWTNLPTKPLFVPLIHETLLGVLGTQTQPHEVQAVSGDLPTFDATWTGATKLDRLSVANDLWVDFSNTDLAAAALHLKTGQAGTALAAPVSFPGVYQATTDDGPRRLAVNPDPLAGDTRAIDEEALIRWLDGLGEWRWLDEANPGAALQQTPEADDVGWALLWIVLALVLVETVVSRRFSHAGAGQSASLTGQLWRTAMRLRSGDKADRKRGRAA